MLDSAGTSRKPLPGGPAVSMPLFGFGLGSGVGDRDVGSEVGDRDAGSGVGDRDIRPPDFARKLSSDN